MEPDSYTNHSDSGNPYRSPTKTNGEPPPQSCRRRRFRKRLIPATLLWSFCPLLLLGYLVAIAMVLYTNIQGRWVDSDLERLRYVNERVLSPPAVAHCIFGIAGAVCGIFGGFAWVRGSWRRAIILTASFLLLMVLVGYISVGIQ